MIIKYLKYGKFWFNDETKEFGAEVKVWNKTYTFAFIRFVLRIAQRNWFRKRVKKGK